MGIGPEIRADFLQVLKELKSSLKSFLVSSDCWQAVWFVSIWTINLIIEDRNEHSRPGSLSKMMGSMTEGFVEELGIPDYGFSDYQCERGQGDNAWWLSWQDDAQCVGIADCVWGVWAGKCCV